jgi:hypothetical protein
LNSKVKIFDKKSFLKEIRLDISLIFKEAGGFGGFGPPDPP